MCHASNAISALPVSTLESRLVPVAAPDSNK